MIICMMLGAISGQYAISLKVQLAGNIFLQMILPHLPSLDKQLERGITKYLSSTCCIRYTQFALKFYSSAF